MQTLQALRQAIKDHEFESVLITKPENRRYVSGFSGTSAFVLVTEQHAYVITDFRYKDQAARECQGFEILLTSNDKTVYDVISELNLSRIAYEDGFMTVRDFNTYKNELHQIQFCEMGQLLEKLRICKMDFEIQKLRKSAKIADLAFDHIIEFIKPGMKEREVALELEMFMKHQGATALSFDIIVASGWRSSMPHGRASDKRIETGDFVTMDFGCILDGYCSDMTRTVVVGEASEKQKEIYNIVLRAQEEALRTIRPGIRGKDADQVARDIITEAGYGEYFGHGLGHGVGLEVHEDPRLSPIGEIILEKNMVVTDEPGIYIPEFGGVRIEDLVVVTENGCERLSNAPKHLIQI